MFEPVVARVMLSKKFLLSLIVWMMYLGILINLVLVRVLMMTARQAAGKLLQLVSFGCEEVHSKTSSYSSNFSGIYNPYLCKLLKTFLSTFLYNIQII